MPVYEYECEACGGIVEKWQKLADAPLATCPSCGGSLHKLISRSSFQLKGSGWYVTDYAGKKCSAAPAAKPETGSPATQSSSPSCKKETCSSTACGSSQSS